MILVIGGLGFIGQHIARALVDLGERCVLAQRREAQPQLDLGAGAVVERLDVTDPLALREIGRRHEITGIVDLAGPGIGTENMLAEFRTHIPALLTVLEVAHEWGVRRVSIASSIGVYVGAASPFREDVPLPITGTHPIEASKKISEILSTLFAGPLDLEVVNLRIGAVWGPLGRPSSRFFDAPSLVHAAANGTPVDRPVYAGNGIDMCYVRDCGRAIALLQTAETVRHRQYNIGTGVPTTNAEVVAAIRKIVPDADLPLRPGRAPELPADDSYLDIGRLRADTGFEPEYDITSAVADYVGWLRAGHER